MKVRDIMTPQVESADYNTSLIQVAQMMAQQDVGSIPVCEQNELRGILTDRDLVVRAVSKGVDLNNTRASEIMSTTPVTVSPELDIHEAARLMSESQIRRLPVVENGKLVGMLALGDLAVENIHVNEAGEALNQISQGIQH